MVKPLNWMKQSTLPAALVLALLQSCDSTSSVTSPPQSVTSNPEGLSASTTTCFAGQLRIPVNESPLSPTVETLDGKEISLALVDLEGTTSFYTAFIEDADDQVTSAYCGGDTVSAIYQNDPDVVTFEDYVLIRALMTLPPALRTPDNIATAANDLFPERTPDFQAADFNPVPSSTNTNYVDRGGTPDMLDAALVLAASLLPETLRDPANLAATVNVIFPGANLLPSEILVIPPVLGTIPLQTITVNTTTVDITFRDDLDIDGDIITVFVNGAPVPGLTNLTLSGTGQTFSVELAEGANELSILAVSQGEIPPTTVEISFDPTQVINGPVTQVNAGLAPGQSETLTVEVDLPDAPAPTGSLAAEAVTNGVQLTLTATVPAGLDDQAPEPIFDINLFNLTSTQRLPGSGFIDISGVDILNPPLGLEGQMEVNLTFVLPLEGPVLAQIQDGDILTATLRFQDNQGTEVAVTSPPFTASVIPLPPEAPDVAVIDQISLTANDFILTQTDSTGVVGFGPIAGPGVIDDEYDGPGSSAFPDNGIRVASCGANSFFIGGTAPVFLVDQELGLFTFVNQGTLAPTTTQENPVTLSGQRLTLFLDQNDRLTAEITAANFDELYRINFFQPELLNVNTAICDVFTDTETGQQTFTLSFNQRDVGIDEVLGTQLRLFTLRATQGGNEEPNNGVLQGAQFTSSSSLAEGLVSTADPRFFGVQNLLDVSGNQIRTDIALVFDQIGSDPTQAALNDLPLPGDDNPVSGNPPFVTANGCPAGSPGNENLVCGRFQFNQPFAPTAIDESTDIPDVLVISGTFTGKLIPPTPTP